MWSCGRPGVIVDVCVVEHIPAPGESYTHALTPLHASSLMHAVVPHIRRGMVDGLLLEGTGDGLDVPSFIKLVHDCGLDDRGLSRAQTEEVFLAVKQPGATHLAYTDFLLSLDHIGASIRHCEFMLMPSSSSARTRPILMCSLHPQHVCPFCCCPIAPPRCHRVSV